MVFKKVLSLAVVLVIACIKGTQAADDLITECPRLHVYSSELKKCVPLEDYFIEIDGIDRLVVATPCGEGEYFDPKLKTCQPIVYAIYNPCPPNFKYVFEVGRCVADVLIFNCPAYMVYSSVEKKCVHFLEFNYERITDPTLLYKACPVGQYYHHEFGCIYITQFEIACPANFILVPELGKCVANVWLAPCKNGEIYDPIKRECVPVLTYDEAAFAGYHSQHAIDDPWILSEPCPGLQYYDREKGCVPLSDIPFQVAVFNLCPPGFTYVFEVGMCLATDIIAPCKSLHVYDSAQKKCVPYGA